ncbi:hypothetical protein TH66_22655 [Carbonactinospora thermoautotrophica]|uniref:Uncharacterized protein n=1 Tax=Carbonactinospora thermoautotrophica TaxID=1469144 RepID=A0A132N8N8_9ACTN|nr:hypothetical protein TH66_22655 [Carbonactinospora thermoautotrophica]KWX06521.1 hypothetical protein TR74_21805 [Carbonactinospora thermoautotrophica]
MNATPHSSEELCPVTRRKVATMSSGVMTQISMLPPSSATNRSPDRALVMLSTPASGTPGTLSSYAIARVLLTASYTQTRLSPLVVN